MLHDIKRINENYAEMHLHGIDWQKGKWVFLRVTFLIWIGLSMMTVVSGFVGAPLSSYYFFGTWRFWKYWSPGWRLSYHAYRIMFMMLRGEFALRVPLASPPTSVPDRNIVKISPNWEYGESCGNCGVCCDVLKCPLLEKGKRICLGYNSFFWRYFNCGRFPSTQREIDRYQCRKWEMK